MDVLARIKEILDKREWTLYRLSKQCDIPHSTLNNLFLRENTPSIETIEKICNGLGITLSEFFADDTKRSLSKNKLTKKQASLLERYNALPTRDKELLEAFLSGLEKKVPPAKKASPKK